MNAAAARSSSSFGVAFRILPPPQRAALDALYGFCRAVDDAVDEIAAPDDARRELDAWRGALDSIFDGKHETAAALPADTALVAALADAAQRYPIRRADLDAVIEGCAWDLEGRRYPTWLALRDYCLHVASAVGLAAIEIFGYRDPRARDYAIDLGIALQLTNILRDIDEDAARGRIYLPAEDLANFGVEPADLVRDEQGRRPAAVARLLAFEAERAHAHYARALALSATERAHLVAAEVMRDVYYALLLRLEKSGFPHTRAALSKPAKIGIVVRRLVIARGVRLGESAARFARTPVH